MTIARDSARPAGRKRPAKPAAATARVVAPPRSTETLFSGLDRFGLAPILLLALAYLGHTQVVVPIAVAYAKMVDTVGDTNRLLRESIEKNNREDGERVATIAVAQAENRRLSEENRELNARILSRLDELQAIISAAAPAGGHR